MKILACTSGAIAVVSVVLAVVARLFFPDKSLFGLHALTFLRVTNTMLLFAIAFLMYQVVKKA